MANFQDDFDRQAQINELVNGSGIQAPVDPATAGVTPPVEAPDAPAAPKPSYAMGGFDAGKLADPNHNTEKYQVGRVFQKYDPAGGLTPELLAELNALNIGDFSGQGDKLSVKGARNGARWTDGMGDVIQNYSGDGPKTWTGLDTNPEEIQAQMPQDQGAGTGPDSSSLMPQGDAYGSEGFFQRLLAQLQQQLGPESTDREALLKEMGA